MELNAHRDEVLSNREFSQPRLGFRGLENDMVKLILVVEDKEEEQVKALAAIRIATGSPDDPEDTRGKIIPGSPQVGLKIGRVLVFFSANLEVAEGRLKFLEEALKVGPRGIVTDLMFPGKKGAKEEPNGLAVVVSAIHSGIPVVVCSDTDHHDVNYLKTVFPVLGSAHPKGEIPVILDNKDWDVAIAALLRLMDDAG